MTLQQRTDLNTEETAPKTDVHPDLASFAAAGDLSPKAVTAFLNALSSPLVEPGALTFLWRGQASRVELLRWINAGVDRLAFAPLGQSGVWFLRVPVQDGGRFEYKLNIVNPYGEDWVLDPLNPHRAGDPFGENSVAMTYGYAKPDWSIARGAPAGRIDDIVVDSAVFTDTRRERIYLPHGYDSARTYPLVIVHDGGDYDAFGDLTISLDNLIDDGSIAPVIVALIQTADRMGEYPRGRRHARYVVGELLPALMAAYPISPARRNRVLLGASLGAVASLSTAYRYPAMFGGLVLMSGTFILEGAKLKNRRHPVFMRTARLVEVLKRAPAPENLRAFISTGELEGLASENRALAEMLEDRGIEILFQSSWDGHHWHNWRDQLRDALIWVLPMMGGAD